MLALSFAFIFSAVSEAYSDDSVKGLLTKGWEEYGYGIFDSARKNFNEVLSKPSLSDSEYCEAMTGLAFCHQFGKGSNVSESDYRKAIECYKLAIAKSGGDRRIEEVLRSMQAECLLMIFRLSRNTELLSEAQAICDSISSGNEISLASQNSILAGTVFKISDLSSEDSLQSLRKLEAYLDKSFEKRESLDKESRLLLPAMARLLAEISVSKGDYQNAVKYFDQYLAFGATSHVTRAQVTFKLARIYDLKLKNPSKAIEYYNKFRKENPNDVKAYFAEQRVSDLDGAGAGK